MRIVSAGRGGGGDESVQSAPMIQLAKSSGRSGNPQAAPAMDGRCDLLKAIRDGNSIRVFSSIQVVLIKELFIDWHFFFLLYVL